MPVSCGNVERGQRNAEGLASNGRLVGHPVFLLVTSCSVHHHQLPLARAAVCTAADGHCADGQRCAAAIGHCALH